MCGTDDREVPVVHRGDGRDPEPFGDCHDRRVDEAETKVVVCPDQISAACPITADEVDQFQFTGSDRRDELSFGMRVEPLFDHPRALGRDGRGDGDASALIEERSAFGMLDRGPVGGREQHIGIDEQHSAQMPSANFFSASSARSR